jgi:hypothetical protein
MSDRPLEVLAVGLGIIVPVLAVALVLFWYVAP